MAAKEQLEPPEDAQNQVHEKHQVHKLFTDCWWTHTSQRN